MKEVKEFLLWLEKERDEVIKAGRAVGINTEILEQHYDKIIRKYRGDVYGQALCNTFEASQN